MIKRLSLLMTLFLLAAILSGCWDSEDISSLDVVMCVWIDEGDIPGTVKLGAQLNQGKAAQSANGIALSNIANISYEMTGETVTECMNKLMIASSYSLFLQSNQAIIISDSLAEKGLTKFLDFFLRDRKSRMDVWLYIAEGKAADIAGANVKEEDSAAIALNNLTNKKDNLSTYWGVTLLDYYQDFLKEQRAVLVPIVSVLKGTDDIETFAINHMAVVREDRMVGKLNNEEAGGYNWLMGRFDNGRINSESEYGDITFDTKSEHSDIVTRFDPSNELTLDVYIQTDVFVVDAHFNDEVTRGDIDAIVLFNAKRGIDQQVKNALRKAQSMSADIFGLGHLIYIRDHKRWELIKDRWPEIYKNMQVNLIIEIKAPYNLKYNTPADMKEILEYGKTT